MVLLVGYDTKIFTGSARRFSLSVAAAVQRTGPRDTGSKRFMRQQECLPKRRAFAIILGTECGI
jgi:hypothetical protein